MNELKSKIFTLKVIGFIFKLFLTISIVLFLLFGFKSGENALRNELILSFMTAFNFVSVRITEYYIDELIKQYHLMQKQCRKAKIICFDKIA